MKSNPQIRQEARQKITGNWLTLALIVFLIMLLSCAFQWKDVVDSIKHPFSNYSAGFNWHSSASWVTVLFLVTPVTYSVLWACLKLLRGEKSRIKVEDMFCAFGEGRYIKLVVLGFLIKIFTLLWTLLLIIPGIIKAISYSMAPYILLDNPEMSVMDAIDESQEMMRGHKMDYFLMMLGEIGFGLLSIVTLGIALFWIEGYYYVAYSNFYLSLKSQQQGEQPSEQPSYLQPEA